MTGQEPKDHAIRDDQRHHAQAFSYCFRFSARQTFIGLPRPLAARSRSIAAFPTSRSLGVLAGPGLLLAGFYTTQIPAACSHAGCARPFRREKRFLSLVGMAARQRKRDTVGSHVLHVHRHVVAEPRSCVPCAHVFHLQRHVVADLPRHVVAEARSDCRHASQERYPPPPPEKRNKSPTSAETSVLPKAANRRVSKTTLSQSLNPKPYTPRTLQKPQNPRS